VADTVSANVIGLVLGSVVRFVLYRYWVYSPTRAAGAAARRAAVPEVQPQPHLPTGSIRILTQP
jgi:hypothetical protein